MINLKFNRFSLLFLTMYFDFIAITLTNNTTGITTKCVGMTHDMIIVKMKGRVKLTNF